MIKLIVTDIDGCIYDKNKLVTNLINQLKILKNKGIYCTFATGMGIKRINYKIDFKPNCAMIVEDGGRIISPEGETIIAHPFLADDLVVLQSMLEQSKISMVAFACLTNQKYICLAKDDKALQTIKNGLAVSDVVITDNAESFIEYALQFGCTRVSIFARENSNFVYDTRLRCVKNLDHINITIRGVDKGTALIELINLLEINLQETLVIGDDFNDIPMFSLPVGFKISVSNRSPQLLALATHQVENPDQLSEVILKIIDQQK
ncbi:MAG: HAD-IIB family hydrolase [Patescibacteria group bacterium]